MAGVISPLFGGYVDGLDLVLLTSIRLSPPGHARPSERHASPSANTAAYSARCIILSGVTFCPFLKCYITIRHLVCRLAFDLWQVATNAIAQPKPKGI